MTATSPALVRRPTSRRAGMLGGAAGLLAGTAGVALAVAQAGWWRDLLGDDGTPQPVATGLEHIAGTLAALLLCWVAVLLLLGAAAVSPGHLLQPVRRTGALVAPRWVPRIGALLLALAVSAPAAASAASPGPPAAAVAATTPAPVPDWSGGPGGPVLVGASDADGAPAPQPGWQPSEPRPRADVRLLVGDGPRTGAAASEVVVVRAGDTLWSITARHLGPDASPEDIAAEWPRWHAVNSDVIGPNPDLIRPGQELVAPPTHAPTGAQS